jgi:DNA-binding NtrC family response regulator
VGGNGDGTAERGLPSLRLEDLERLAIEEALGRTGWHQGQAAELLGISDRTLHRKIRSLGLRRPG